MDVDVCILEQPKASRQLICYEFDSKNLDNPVLKSLLKNLSRYVLILDSTDELSFDKLDKSFQWILSNQSMMHPRVAIFLNKTDQREHNTISLDEFEKLKAWLSKKEEFSEIKISLWEGCALSGQNVLESLNWLTSKEDVEFVGQDKKQYAIVYKLDATGPSLLHKTFDELPLNLERDLDEYIDELIINFSVALGRGGQYSEGLSIIQLEQRLRMVTYSWRMLDYSENRDFRLDRGYYLLGIICQQESSILKLSFVDLEHRFERHSDVLSKIPAQPELISKFLSWLSA